MAPSIGMEGAHMDLGTFPRWPLGLAARVAPSLLTCGEKVAPMIRKTLLAFALWLLAGSSALAALTVPQTPVVIDSTSGANPLVPTLGAGTASGSAIVSCYISTGGATGVTFADDKGDTPTAAIPFTNLPAGGLTGACSVFLTATAGAKAVTVTQTGGVGTFWSASAVEIAGCGSGCTIDVHISNGATSAGPATSGSSGTLASANEVLVSMGSGSGNITGGEAGWTFQFSAPNTTNGHEYEIVSANTAQSATYALSASTAWDVLLVSLSGPTGPAPTNGLLLMGVGGTLNHGDGSGGLGTLAPGYFVSTAGSDSNAGTLAAPWQTIFHAQQVMRGNSCSGTPTGLCLTYVRGGTYSLTANIIFTSADSGETVQYYPPDGFDSAVLDGGGNGSFGSNTGFAAIIQVAGVSNFTINGLKLQNFDQYGIQFGGGPSSDVAGIDTHNSSGLLFENIDCGHNTFSSGDDSHSGCIFGTGIIPGTQVKNNYCHDLVAGCVLLLPYYSGDTADGSVISGNVAINGINSISDIGDYYVSGHGGFQNVVGITIQNNYSRDRGAANHGGQAAVYLDDNANLVTVTGNIIGAPKATAGTGSPPRSDVEAFEVHNGHNNTFKFNVVDLGTAANVYEVLDFQDGASIAGMANNTYTNSIIVMNFAGSNATTGFCSGSPAYCQNSAASNFTVGPNAYHNYGSGSETTTGSVVGDSNPQHISAANLKLTCPNGIPSIDPTSTAITGTTAFPGITAGWGPPGFTIPASTNHSC
jgi:hypothetical protein